MALEGEDHWDNFEGEEDETERKWEAEMKIKNSMDLNTSTASSDEWSHFEFIDQFSDSDAPSWCESDENEESVKGTGMEMEKVTS